MPQKTRKERFVWIKKALLKLLPLRKWEKVLLSLALIYGLAPLFYLLSMVLLGLFVSATAYMYLLFFIAVFSVGLSSWLLRLVGLEKTLIIGTQVNFDVLGLLMLLNFLTLGVVVLGVRGIQTLLEASERRKAVAAQKTSSSRGHDYWG